MQEKNMFLNNKSIQETRLWKTSSFKKGFENLACCCSLEILYVICRFYIFKFNFSISSFSDCVFTDHNLFTCGGGNYSEGRSTDQFLLVCMDVKNIFICQGCNNTYSQKWHTAYAVFKWHMPVGKQHMLVEKGHMPVWWKVLHGCWIS